MSDERITVARSTLRRMFEEWLPHHPLEEGMKPLVKGVTCTEQEPCVVHLMIGWDHEEAAR